MIKNLDNTLKKIERQLADHQRKMSYSEKRIQKLQANKNGILELAERFPNAKFDGGDVYIDDLDNNWDKIAGLSIDRTWDKGLTHLKIKFSMNKKNSGGIKVYMLPSQNTIATMNRYATKDKQPYIEIFDYKSLISDKCPRKKAFVKRIKKFILANIKDKKLTILDSSHDKSEFLKLMLLA